MTIFHSYVSLPEGSLKLLPEKGTNNNKQHIFFHLEQPDMEPTQHKDQMLHLLIIFTNLHIFLTPKNGTLVFCTFEPESWTPWRPKMSQTWPSSAARLAAKLARLDRVVVCGCHLGGDEWSKESRRRVRPMEPRHHLKDQSMVLRW